MSKFEKSLHENKKKLVIVIPIYKTSLSKEKKLSFEYLDHFLPNYDKCFVAPKKLRNKIKRESYKTIFFPNNYFISIRTYSELMSTKKFYESFINYKYILVYQPDAIIFSDKINYFINKNYDYIGAPLLKSKIGSLTCKKGQSKTGGNGGLSLRKVDKFIKVIELTSKEAKRSTENQILRKLWFIQAVIQGKSHKKWLKAAVYCYPFNEDGFWSFEAVKYLPTFKIAPLKEALKFAFERFPRKCFEMNNRKLPFGVHAWAKYDKDFWLPFLESKKPS